MNRWALVALLLGATACHGSSHHGEEGGEYPVTRPLKKDAEVSTEYVAQVRAIQHIELRALEGGYLEGIFVDEGQKVTEGQRMFQIMPRIYDAELRKARAEAEFAEIEYKNTKALQDGNVVSPNELALAKAQLDKARAEVSLAQVHYDLAQVRAPFDGIMGRLEVRRGSLVEEGELLTTLSDNSQMWVYFNVTEAEYLDYKIRMDAEHPLKVQLRLANGRVFDHEGVVQTIEADFNNETGNIAFRATFPNPDGLLRHGETGQVVVTTVLDDALLVPQKATFDILDRKYVFVVDEHNVAHSREIKVIEEMPHVYAVGSGVSPDDRVLLDGLRKVRDGQEVEVVDEDPEEVMAHLDLHAE